MELNETERMMIFGLQEEQNGSSNANKTSDENESRDKMVVEDSTKKLLTPVAHREKDGILGKRKRTFP
jgi:hypothetical protein